VRNISAQQGLLDMLGPFLKLFQKNSIAETKQKSLQELPIQSANEL
jgi:hypothetical protein